jgi:excisionase family DNA binding protein
MNYMDTKQTAEALGVSPRTLEGWRQTGEGPKFAKVGRRVLYDPEDVNAWLDASKRTKT